MNGTARVEIEFGSGKTVVGWRTASTMYIYCVRIYVFAEDRVSVREGERTLLNMRICPRHSFLKNSATDTRIPDTALCRASVEPLVWCKHFYLIRVTTLSTAPERLLLC